MITFILCKPKSFELYICLPILACTPMSLQQRKNTADEDTKRHNHRYHNVLDNQTRDKTYGTNQPMW